MIAKDLQCRDFTLPLLDIEVGKVVDDEDREEKGKENDDDGNRDDGVREAGIVHRGKGIGDVDDGEAAEDEGRASGDGEDRHDEVLLVAAEVANRGLVAEGEDFPKRDPFEEDLLAGLRGNGLEKLGRGGFQEAADDPIGHEEDDQNHDKAADKAEGRIHQVDHLRTEEGRLEGRVDGHREGIDADDRSHDQGKETAEEGEEHVFELDP